MSIPIHQGTQGRKFVVDPPKIQALSSSQVGRRIAGHSTALWDHLPEWGRGRLTTIPWRQADWERMQHRKTLEASFAKNPPRTMTRPRSLEPPYFQQLKQASLPAA